MSPVLSVLTQASDVYFIARPLFVSYKPPSDFVSTMSPPEVTILSSVLSATSLRPDFYMIAPESFTSASFKSRPLRASSRPLLLSVPTSTSNVLLSVIRSPETFSFVLSFVSFTEMLSFVLPLYVSSYMPPVFVSIAVGCWATALRVPSAVLCIIVVSSVFT